MRLMTRRPSSDDDPARLPGTGAPRAADDPWRLVFAAHPQPMWIYDRNTLAFLDVNDAAVAVYCYTRDEFLTMRITDIRPVDDIPDLLKAVWMTSGTSAGEANRRWNHRRKDGRLLEVEIVSRPLAYVGVSAKLVLARDVSARVQAELELERERHLIDALMEHSPDLVYTKDGASRFTRANRATARALGREQPEEVVGRTDRDFYPEELAEQFLEDERRMLASGQTVLNRLERQTGAAPEDERWLLTTKIPIRDHDGAVAGLLGVAKDVTELRRAEDALRRSEERFRSLILHASDAVSIIAADGTRLYASPAVERTLGYRPDEMIGTRFGTGAHPDDSPRVEGFMRDVLAHPGEPRTIEARSLHRDGTYRVIELTATNCLGDENVAGIVLNSRDVTERRTADEALRQSERRFRGLFQNAADVVAVLNADATVRYVSPSVGRVLGYTAEQLEGYPHAGLSHPDDVARVEANFASVLSAPGIHPPIECRLRHQDGTWRRLELRANNLLADPAVGGIVLNARDVTERWQAEQRLIHLAYHDELTGLPNRTLFGDRLEHALARVRRRQEGVGVVLMDLDRFKVVNDALGHDTGDRLLTAVAGRLQAALRDGDTLARFASDEFSVLVEQVDTGADVAAVAERLIEALRAPFDLDGREAFVTASAGVAVAEVGEHDPREVLRRADLALSRAKETGRDSVATFEAAMGVAATARLDLEQELRLALARDELRVYYQPIVDLATGRPMRMEALVRWEHPTRGWLLPCAFVPLAEETGLIRPIGQWVLDEACHQARRWQRANPNGAPAVSVNLSACQFRDPRLAEVVAAALGAAGLAPADLELELTESMLMEHATGAVTTLAALSRLGVRLAIDDFGTGYSSLAYLRRFPIDHLKVDRSFIDDAPTAQEGTILEAVVDLGHALGLRVTAEGVETAAQLARIRDLGFDGAQGYHFARPFDAEAAAAFVAAAGAAVGDAAGATDRHPAPGRVTG